MTEQQHTELVREFTVKSPKHPYPALDVDAMFAEIVRLRVVAQANYRNMERLGVEVEQLREMLCESLLERGVLRAQAEGSAADANAAARPLAAYRAYRAKREGEA